MTLTFFAIRGLVSKLGLILDSENINKTLNYAHYPYSCMRRISVRTYFPSLILNILMSSGNIFFFINKHKLRWYKPLLKWYKVTAKIFACLFKYIYFYVFPFKSVQFVSKMVLHEGTHLLTISRNLSRDFVRFPVDLQISFQSPFVMTHGCFQVRCLFDCFGGFVFSIRNLV